MHNYAVCAAPGLAHFPGLETRITQYGSTVYIGNLYIGMAMGGSAL